MREWRTPDESIIDKALYLSLLDLVAHQKTEKGTVIGNRIKCMKLPFLAEYPMFEKRSKGFNLTFFQYDYGPISKNIYEVWRDLEGVGCIAFIEKNWIELKEEGHQLAHTFIDEVLSQEENRAFLNQLRDTAERYGRLATPAILNIVYNLDVFIAELGRSLKVREVPMGMTLIYTLDDEDSSQKLKVSQNWLETLAIELNPENKQSITKAIKDYHQGRILSHEKVWGDVP